MKTFKNLKIERCISQCQDCVFMVEGEHGYICNNDKIIGNISITKLDEINENCPLPDASKYFLDIAQQIINDYKNEFDNNNTVC